MNDMYALATAKRLLESWQVSLTPGRDGTIIYPGRIEFDDWTVRDIIAQWIITTRSHLRTHNEHAIGWTDRRMLEWAWHRGEYDRLAALTIDWDLYWLCDGKRPIERPMMSADLRRMRGFIRHQLGCLSAIETALIDRARLNRYAT